MHGRPRRYDHWVKCQSLLTFVATVYPSQSLILFSIVLLTIDMFASSQCCLFRTSVCVEAVEHLGSLQTTYTFCNHDGQSTFIQRRQEAFQKAQAHRRCSRRRRWRGRRACGQTARHHHWRCRRGSRGRRELGLCRRRGRPCRPSNAGNEWIRACHESCLRPAWSGLPAQSGEYGRGREQQCGAA